MNEFLNVGESLEIQEISKFWDRKECSGGEEQVSDKNHEPDEVGNSDTENGQMNEISYNKQFKRKIAINMQMELNTFVIIATSNLHISISFNIT